MGSERQRQARWRGFAAAAGLVATATLLGVLAQRHFAAADFVMLFLLAVAVAAARFGRGPALLSSALSVLAYDFFFVEPHHTFAVADERHLLTFATLFVVGLLISALSDAARRAALKAHTEELRSSLLSTVSHDLRTPLAALTGAASALRERGAPLDEAQRAELVETVCVEAERLERLVANLLDMSRLEAGPLNLKQEWVSLEEVVGAALARAGRPLGARPVRTDLPADLPLVPGDPVLLEQLFFNLLENAARYTPADAQVHITARRTVGGLAVEVADTGAGLPPGSEARVFEKFFRGTQGGEGAGLGLAICRAIAVAHGGDLTAANRPGGGAVFLVTLPVPASAPKVPDEGAASFGPEPVA